MSTYTHISEMRNVYSSKWNLLFDKSIKEWISFKPKLGLQVYPCYACRHIFGSKNSFLDHVNRRSICIKYNCNNCANVAPEDLKFYNPCSFHLHIRQHFTVNSGMVDLDDLEISLLPVGLAGFLPHPDVKMLYERVEDDENYSGYINNRFYNPSIESYGQRIVYFTPNEVFLFNSVSSNQSFHTLALKQTSWNIPKCILVETDYINLNRFPIAQFSHNVSLNLNSNNAVVLSRDASNVPVSSEILLKTESHDESDSPVSFEYTLPIITKVETLLESDTSMSPLSLGEDLGPSCSECKEVPNESMSSHFLQENKPIDDSLRCSVCKFIAPSSCSFNAHRRVHLFAPPFVCPECGKIYNNWDSLYLHITEVCYHLAKQVRVRCPAKKCGKIFAQNVTFSAHFVSVHLKTNYVCDFCQDISTSNADYLEHVKNWHDGKDRNYTVFTCNVCSNDELISADAKEEHLRFHGEDKMNLVYVHVCKYCRSFFKSSATYATHRSRCSKTLANMEQKTKNDVPSLLSQTIKSPYEQQVVVQRGETTDTNSKVHLIVTICSRCNVRLKFQVTNLQSMLSSCPKCGESLYLPIKSLSMPGKDVQINEPSQRNTEVLDLLVDDEENICVLCRTNIENIREHVNVCKYAQPEVVICKLPKPEIEEEESPSPKSDDSSRKKRRRYDYNRLTNKHRKLLASENYPELQSNEPIQPLPFDGTYHCRLCQFSHVDREVFCAHIHEHRLVSTSYQCMECGECFVVKPSLAKHLQFYHQIFDFETYLEQNDCYDKDAVKELEENMRMVPGESKRPVKDNQCRICMQEFQTDIELNKHFRVHGMAFLSHNVK